MRSSSASSASRRGARTGLSSRCSRSSAVRACDDVRKFLTVRTVGGGAVWAGMYLGKAVRWYYSRGVPESVCIRYKTNGNKVSRSNGSMPCMTLPAEVPSDVDYDWYVREANDILKDIGHG